MKGDDVWRVAILTETFMKPGKVVTLTVYLPIRGSSFTAVNSSLTLFPSQSRPPLQVNTCAGGEKRTLLLTCSVPHVASCGQNKNKALISYQSSQRYRHSMDTAITPNVSVDLGKQGIHSSILRIVISGRPHLLIVRCCLQYDHHLSRIDSSS